MGLGNLAAAEKMFVQAMDNGKIMKIHWRVLESTLGLAEVKARLNRPGEGLVLSTLVMSDPACPRDLRNEAAKLAEDLTAKAKPEEAKAIQAGAASMDAKMITDDVIAMYKAETRN